MLSNEVITKNVPPSMLTLAASVVPFTSNSGYARLGIRILLE